MYYGNLTPQIIVKNDVKFMVPLYQRLFAWSKTEVSQLLYDLKSHFEKWPDAKSSEMHFPYHLGVITTVPFKERYCLVDGQQRCTVLMIMASVFGRISPEWKAFFENGSRLELFAREDDAKFLRGLADGITQGKYANALMAEAYRAIEDFLAEMDADQQKVFIDRCFSGITILNSILPSNYLQEPASLNKYFEIMNSAGVNLEKHEILKVSLLNEQIDQTKLLKIWNLCSDFSAPLLCKKEDVSDKEYSDKYMELLSQSTDEAINTIIRYNNISESSEENNGLYPSIAEIDVEPQEFNNPFGESNERSVLSFPEFLLLTLDIYRNLNGDRKFYKVDELNERFKANLLNTPTDVSGFYEMLLKLRIALDFYVIRRKIDGQDSEYSLIYHDTDNMIDNNCLEQYEAMLSVSTPYYKWLKIVLECVLDNQSGKTSADILAALKAWDNEQHPYPASVSELSYGNVDRYWFWRLDYYLWEQIAGPKEPGDETIDSYRQIRPYRQAILDYTFRTNRSIEHLHPQNEANNTSWDRGDIDSFGNLAMISQSFNSQQSNEDVHVKFSRVETQARNKTLQSIKLLRMYISVKGNPDGWTPEAAKKHEDEMMKLLHESYLKP